MKLCYDDVKNWGLCIPYLLHFRRNYSEPTELIDIINDKYFSIRDLKYGFERVGMLLSQEEREAYYKRIGVDKESMPYVYNSDNVNNSILVFNSSSVLNSERVYKGREVENSKYVLESSIVKDSIDIYSSNYITNSSSVIKSLNISSSDNIYRSNYIMDSHSIAKSSWVNKSYNIIDSSRVVDSAFCRNVSNIDHCIFCFGIQNKSYYIFNQPASDWVYKFTTEQLNHYLKYELNLMTIVRDDMYPVDPIETPPTEWFSNYPDGFMQWLSTIPLFNKDLMLGLTLDARFNS